MQNSDDETQHTQTGTRVIAIVDDDASVRSGLSFLFSSVGIESREYESGDAFLGAGDAANDIACILLDVRMPGTNGIDVLSVLGTRPGTPPVIILTGHADVPMAIRAMKSGAFDFVEKPFNQQVLLDSVQSAFGSGELKRAHAERLAEVRERFTSLTTREQEVFTRVVEGMPNRAIAEQLGIKEKTIELHRSKVMRKMAAGSLAELVRMSVTLEAG
ncbi:MAG: response regulator [Planctomycetota bacterium]